MSERGGELDRRRFAGALAAGLALAAGSSAAAEQRSGEAQAKAEDRAEGKPEKPEGKPEERPAFDPLAWQLAYLMGAYPSDRMTTEGLRIVAGKLASQLAHGRVLSEFPLTNADGPGFVFSAYRAPSGGPNDGR